MKPLSENTPRTVTQTTTPLQTTTLQEKIREAVYRYDILRPSGNDTCLIKAEQSTQDQRQSWNKQMMSYYPSVEQVGILSEETGTPTITMAGGEFCGNATRAAAWSFLNGQTESMNIRSSGIDNSTLRAGVDRTGNAWTQVPINPSFDCIQTDPSNPNLYIVSLKGITQVVLYQTTPSNIRSPEQLKADAYQLLQSQNLLSEGAAGVMYITSTNEGLQMEPVVYVRDIDTLFYETACGSGTAALGMVESYKNMKASTNTAPQTLTCSVLQPSGSSIEVQVAYTSSAFTSVQISGPIIPLANGVLVEQAEPFIIEQCSLAYGIQKYPEIIQLYQETFAQAPYWEAFTQEEVQELLEQYQQTGILLTARTETDVIGFAAALPITTLPELQAVVAPFVECSNMWYMADLGVRSNRRRQGIARRLVEERIARIPSTSPILMRTSIDNTASQSLYRSLGFTDIPGCIQNVTQTRIGETTPRSDQRIFLLRTPTNSQRV